MLPVRLPLILTLLVSLAACQTTPEPPVRRAEAPVAPLVAAGDGCWATATVPAQTETRYVANADGSRHPVQVPVRPAEQRLFAVPCAEALTPDLIASLQRALAARGLYNGPISGVMDTATGEGLRRYQAPLGLDTAVLSLDGARHLGLIALGRDGG